MSEQIPVGAAAWGGMTLPSEIRPVEAVPDAPEIAARPGLVEMLRDIASLILVCLALPLVAAGAGVQWGVGAGLLAGGLGLGLIGVLIGFGER